MERFERKITLVDVVMIALALVSLGLLIYDEVYRPPAVIHQRIIWADYAIIGIFAIEYIIRLLQAKDKMQFIKSRWYDLIGMVPVSHPLFRSFRFARLFRIVVLGSRLVRATDRSLGEAWVRNRVQKYQAAFVEELTDPIVLAVLGVAEKSVSKGHFGSAVANGLRSKREALLARIDAQLKESGTMNLLLKIPGLGHELEKIPGRVLDNMIETVGSKEIDDTIQAVIAEIFADLKREVAASEWKRAAADATLKAKPA